MRPIERRSSPRITPQRPVAAKVKASIPARVLDISAQGMQIELDTSLCPNVTCELRIILDDGDVNLRATVRRCRAWGFGLGDKDQRVLVYRAGIEFGEIPPECLDRLRSQLLTGDQGIVGEPGGDGNATGAAGQRTFGDSPFPLEELEATDHKPAPDTHAPRDGPVKIRINAANVRRILDSKKS